MKLILTSDDGVVLESWFVANEDGLKETKNAIENHVSTWNNEKEYEDARAEEGWTDE